MANKIKAYSPKMHRKGTTEEGVDVEYEEIFDPFVLKSPKGANSIIQDMMDKPNEPTTFRMRKTGTMMTKQPDFEEDFDESEIEELFNQLKNQKKSILLK